MTQEDVRHTARSIGEGHVANNAPPNATAIALLTIFVISTAFLFASYCFARALIGGFIGSAGGVTSGVGTVLLACIATAGASIFLWWLVPLADFAEIFWVHLPADRRATQAKCPACGYPHHDREFCSECGESTAPLPAWTLTWRPVRRFSIVLLLAWCVGSLAGEAWTRLDEIRFEQEAAAQPGAPYARSRGFPTSFARMTADADGRYSSAPWIELGRERAWKTSDPARRERGLGWKERVDDSSNETK
jgi:hypothetical protein